MMKKFLRTALLAAAVLSLVSGCSLFASGGGDEDASGSTGGVKMTDSYTFEDPADLAFDTRYVLHCDENSTFVSNAASYGVVGTYSILYEKDGAPAGDYEFFICDTAEHTQGVIDLYAAQGTTLNAAEEDPCVVYAFTDGDTLEASIAMMQGVGAIKDATVAAYADFMKGNTGAALVE